MMKGFVKFCLYKAISFIWYVVALLLVPLWLPLVIMIVLMFTKSTRYWLSYIWDGLSFLFTLPRTVFVKTTFSMVNKGKEGVK